MVDFGIHLHTCFISTESRNSVFYFWGGVVLDHDGMATILESGAVGGSSSRLTIQLRQQTLLIPTKNLLIHWWRESASTSAAIAIRPFTYKNILVSL